MGKQLYINTYGAYLHVTNQMFEVRTRQANGQVEKSPPLAPQNIRSIVFTNQGAVSTEAIQLASKYSVELVFSAGDGRPYSKTWHCKMGRTAKTRRRQLEISMSREGVFYIKQWVGKKVQNQLTFLQDLQKKRPKRHSYLKDRIGRLQALHASLQSLEAACIEEVAGTVRGLEGTAGRLYWEVLSDLLSEPYRFRERSKRPAKDPFNAFLNYAYGILYGKVERCLLLAGLDPYLGFLHRDEYNHTSFVFDFIEPYRIYADTVVFRLFSGKEVTQRHTDMLAQGCSLNKEGKELLIPAFTGYMDEEMLPYGRRRETRSMIMQLEANAVSDAFVAESGKEGK